MYSPAYGFPFLCGRHVRHPFGVARQRRKEATRASVPPLTALLELLKDNGFNVHLNDDRSVNIVGVGTLKISGATVTLEAKHPFSVIRIYRDVPAVQDPKRLGEENPHPWAHAIVMHPEVRERIDAAPDFHSVSVYPYGCVLAYVGIDTEESRNAILWFIEFYRLLLERLYGPLIDVLHRAMASMCAHCRITRDFR